MFFFSKWLKQASKILYHEDLWTGLSIILVDAYWFMRVELSPGPTKDGGGGPTKVAALASNVCWTYKRETGKMVIKQTDTQALILIFVHDTIYTYIMYVHVVSISKDAFSCCSAVRPSAFLLTLMLSAEYKPVCRCLFLWWVAQLLEEEELLVLPPRQVGFLTLALDHQEPPAQNYSKRDWY